MRQEEENLYSPPIVLAPRFFLAVRISLVHTHQKRTKSYKRKALMTPLNPDIVGLSYSNFQNP